MDIKRGILNIIFKEQSPSQILKSNFESGLKKKGNLHDSVDRKGFVNNGLKYFKQYSEDEIINIYEKMNEDLKDMREITRGRKDEESSPSVFNLLIHFGDDVLTEINGEPFCKYDNLLRWRMISHKLEQDIFTTSYLAYRDVVSSRERNYFSWEPVIRSDNRRLHQMLQKGMAENHFHLKGSAPYFNLTWISLMTRVYKRDNDFKKAGIESKRLDGESNLFDINEKDSIYDLVKKAALIRGFLFAKLNEKNIFDDKEEDKELDRFLTKDSIQYRLNEIQSKISILNNTFGYKFSSNYYLKPMTVDYCIPKNTSERNLKSSNIYLAGERRFLYLMFKSIYKNDEKILKYKNLFYAYLIIKAKFRGELIQVNDRVGFKNFSDYQDRKTKFLSNDPMLYDAVYYMAINSTIKDQNIKSLEARITPEKSKTETVIEIDKIENAIKKEKERIQIFDDSKESKEKEKELLDAKLNLSDKKEDNKHFYVMHFPKIKDKIDYNFDSEDINRKMILSSVPRNNELRKRVKADSINLVSLRDKMHTGIRKVRGIDACANEIGCRPEVFAQSFRFLKNHMPEFKNEEYNIEWDIPELRATYHVGEDFLDIIDGLRAIDEVLLFLDFTQGDRFGHALALGVDPMEWYEAKSKRLIMPIQDYLDNIMWMLAKIREFNIDDLNNVVYFLQNEFNTFFNRVYHENFEDDRFKAYNYNHMVYYDAWKLRGDDPELYFTGKFECGTDICYWDRCKVNNSISNHIRNDSAAVAIYYSYHFNPVIKRESLMQHEVKITDNYIKAVIRIQKEMQKIVLNKGIGIECNPSSNYLIGNFKMYEKHPIIKFNNLGLTEDMEKVQKCEQMFVSINTDDQGVFGTYLENEYAVMALALEKAKDRDGNNIYKQALIYDWLDNIRQMGIEQSFKKRK